jgi:hypothetical protein
MMILPCYRRHYSGERVAVCGISRGVRPALRPKPLADPGVQKRLADLGLEIPPYDRQTPEALTTLQRAEIETWCPIIKAANIKGE